MPIAPINWPLSLKLQATKGEISGHALSYHFHLLISIYLPQYCMQRRSLICMSASVQVDNRKKLRPHLS